MNSAADLKRLHEQTALQKAKDKVIDALKNDPLGLSANQLMTVCRLSIKTVKNILATIDVQEEHGVYFLSGVARAEISTEPQAEQVTTFSRIGGVMDIQKEREALIAEIEVFKAEMLKSYVIKAWADSYVNTDPFSYAIFEDENNKIWWMKAQTHEFWRIWQAAKAQAVPEVVAIGGELQSWVAVHSFAADDGEGMLPVIDANAIAEKIEELTGASQ